MMMRCDLHEVDIDRRGCPWCQLEEIQKTQEELKMLGKPAGTMLTVIIRDDAAMIHCGDTPTYRRVTVALTDDQIDKLMLKATAKSGDRDIFESASNCFLEG